MDSYEAMIGLTHVGGLGPVSIRKLVDHFGTPERIWEARKELPSLPGIKKNLAASMARVDWKEIKEEMKKIEKSKVGILIYGREGYPLPLAHIYDPPSLLYVMGSWKPEDEMGLAIVGTRGASFYGKKHAYGLGIQLGRRGITVISGLARGIDIAAHRGALSGKGRTIAVLGSGLGNIYPEEFQEEVERIAENGAVVSEYPLDMGPARENFPKRNRIISGLSLGVVVVEAGLKSGSLITAHCALEQGREVFSLPGNIDNPNTHGGHRLIQQGAKLVTNVDEILEEILPLKGKAMPSAFAPRKPEEIEKTLSEEDRKILSLLDEVPRSIEWITHQLQWEPSLVCSRLLMMEIKGAVSIFSGQRYARNFSKTGRMD